MFSTDPALTALLGEIDRGTDALITAALQSQITQLRADNATLQDKADRATAQLAHAQDVVAQLCAQLRAAGLVPCPAPVLTGTRWVNGARTTYRIFREVQGVPFSYEIDNHSGRVSGSADTLAQAQQRINDWYEHVHYQPFHDQD